MRRQLVAEQWDKFARAVLSPGASEAQRKAMRRAFYAGAEASLFCVVRGFAPELQPTETDLLQIVSDLNQELNDFAELVKKGRA